MKSTKLIGSEFLLNYTQIRTSNSFKPHNCVKSIKIYHNKGNIIFHLREYKSVIF
jgi:hypothetical protein